MVFTDRKTIPLWPGKAPLSRGDNPEDIPTITPYFPAEWAAVHQAIVILPGGGYEMLAEHEGRGYAEFFAARGYHCFVVNYRLRPYAHPAELSDAARAVRLVRAAAGELGIHPDRIGIMGSSAGGHLAGTAANLYAEALTSADEGNVAQISSRPDFHILCYAVLTLREEFTHRGTRDFICGGDLSLRETLSLETRVHADTPPAFIWHTLADTCVPAENALWYASALRQAKVPFELHVYEKCGHGIGLGGGHPWAEACCRWLETLDSRKV